MRKGVWPIAVMLGLVAASGVALGHAVINEGTAVAGRFTFLTLRITHGCGSSSTTEVRMRVPQGVTRVSPRFTAHWTIEKRMRPAALERRDEAGELVGEDVDEVIWRGGPLPDGYYGEFQVRAMMPDEPGRTLWFPTVQICERGRIEWIQVAADGQNPYDLEEPSPFIRLVAGP